MGSMQRFMKSLSNQKRSMDGRLSLIKYRNYPLGPMQFIIFGTYHLALPEPEPAARSYATLHRVALYQGRICY